MVMPNKDYYIILGVARTESADGIRAAYRALAKRYHPDRVGPNATRHFQVVNEAYHVLSDDERRHAYDLGLAHMSGGTNAPDQPIPTPWRTSQPEPLVPERQRFTLRHEIEGPSNDWVFDRFADALRFRHRGSRLHPLHLDVRLPRQQAFGGGVLSFDVPVFYPCARCRGSGSLASAPCRLCEGSGLSEERERVSIAVPPMVRDGTIVELPLRGLGVNDMYLELELHVV
jgi:DnaJ-class molecular chaperone